LCPEDEHHQFLKYNYARHLIAKGKKRLTVATNFRVYRQLGILAAIADQCEHDMVQRNLRLVVHWAKKFVGRSPFDLDELISQGNVALIRAVQLFDVKHGVRFVTYASRSVQNAFANRLKAYKKWAFREYGESSRECFTESETHGDLLLNMAIDKHRDPADDAEHSDLIQRTMVAMRFLPERTALMIRLRFGLEDGKSRTLQEVGEMFGLTRERMRQIETIAIERLQNVLIARPELLS
jgi:RNA polymerase sigma factor (sigma-70 family)